MSQPLDIERQLQAAQQRLARLQQLAASADGDSATILDATIRELCLSMEELNVTVEELHRQNEDLQLTRQALEQEQLHYRTLFDLAPDGYVVTNRNGLIIEANCAAADLLNRRRDDLVDKPLVLFVAAVDHSLVFEQLRQAQAATAPARSDDAHRIPLIQDQEVVLTPHHQLPLLASVSISAEYNPQGQIVRLYWLFRDLTAAHQTNATLKQVLAELQVLYDQAPCGYHSLDATGRFIRINDTALAMLGYRREEVLGRLIFDFIPPADHPQVATSLDLLYQGKCLQDQECRFLRKDGAILLLSITATPIYDDANNYLMCRAALIDISQRKRTESALRDSEMRYQAIFDQVAVGINQADPSGRYINSNQAFCTMLGYTADELLQLTYQDISHPDDRIELQATYDQLIAGKLPFSLHEKRYRHKAGHYIWTQVAISPLYDDEGHILSDVAVVVNIDDQKQAEAELARREATQRALIQALPDLLVLMHRDGTYLSVEANAEFNLICPLDQMLGHNIRDILPPDVAAIRLQMAALALETGEVQEYEFPIQIDHQDRWQEARLSPVSADEVLVVIRDITKAKQTQAALQRSEEQRRLALDLTGIGWWDWDLQTDQITWSNQTYRLFGYVPGEITPSLAAWQQRLPLDDMQWTVQSLTEDLFSQVRGEGEYRVVHPPDQDRWLLVRAQTIYDSQDQPVRMVGVVIDITERKQAEQALRESEAQFRTVFNSAGIGIVVASPDDLTCRISNPAFQQILGYSSAELATLTFTEITYCDDLDREIPLLQACLTGEMDSYQIEKRYIHKSGALVWGHLVVSVALRNDSGQAQLYIASVQDISERKQMEAQRQQTELTLQRQVNRERLVAEITQQMRQTLDLSDILQAAVAQIRTILQTDRVIVFRFQSTWQGEVIAEAVDPAYRAILATTIYDPCFQSRYTGPDQQGRVRAMADIDQANLQPCYHDLLTSFQVKANLVVPILQAENLWGLLIAHHCAGPRPWPLADIELLQLLADQLGLAIQQAELFQQTHRELMQRRVMQEALQASEERFRTLSESAPIGICQTSPDGLCLYVNQCWQTISGLSLEDCLGDGWLQAVHIEDRRQVQVAWDLFIQTPESDPESHFAQTFRLCDGQQQIRWVTTRADCMRQPDHTVTGYVITQVDITARKQYEEQLQLLELAIASVQEAVLITTAASQSDLPAHTIVYANPAFTKMTGYQSEEILGHSPRFLQGPDTDQATLRQIQQTLIHQQSLQVEILNYRNDRSELWVELSLVPLVNSQGQVSHWVAVRRNISERKRLEAERKQAEQKIKEQAALINIASDAILVRDLADRIVFWSAGAERLYGWTTTEALGQTASQLFSCESLALIEVGLQTVLNQGTWQGELTQLTKTGQTLTVASRWTLMQNAFGQPTSILEVNTDITEKQQLERQFYRAQRLESIGTLASSIAHDLNNVFTPILTIAQMLKLSPINLDERSQEMLEILENSTRRGANLVKQILVFARGGSGERIPLQIEALLNEAIAIVRQTTPESIAVLVDTDPDGLWSVVADPTQIQQVIINLCVNACDAMATGGTLSLIVENDRVDAALARQILEAIPGDYVVITVADTGSGIPPEHIEFIFDPFFTTKPIGKGTGLGLSTAIGIVKSHGGFLQVTSQLGQGTEFKVYLSASPLSLPTDSGVRQSPQPVSASPPSLEGSQEQILVVDDEAMVRQTNSSLLEDYNYRTQMASNGAEAVTLYRQQPQAFALVLIDMMMPVMDGPSAIAILRQINPQIKIIAVSGLSSNEAIALEAGANRFLHKPYSPEQLLRTCRELLNRSEPETGTVPYPSPRTNFHDGPRLPPD